MNISTLKKLVIILVFLAIGLAVFLWIQSTPVTEKTATNNSSPPPNWQRFTHTSLDYSFDYPADFEIKETGERVVVTNGLQVVTTTLEPREVMVNNFELTIEPIRGSWDEIVNELVYEGELTYGENIFREVYTGAEGDGIRAYFLKFDEGRWLEFAKREYFEGSIAEEDKSDPRYLDATEQKELMQQILATVSLENVE